MYKCINLKQYCRQVTDYLIKNKFCCFKELKNKEIFKKNRLKFTTELQKNVVLEFSSLNLKKTFFYKILNIIYSRERLNHSSYQDNVLEHKIGHLEHKIGRACPGGWKRSMRRCQIRHTTHCAPRRSRKRMRVQRLTVVHAV